MPGDARICQRCANIDQKTDGKWRCASDVCPECGGEWIYIPGGAFVEDNYEGMFLQRIRKWKRELLEKYVIPVGKLDTSLGVTDFNLSRMYEREAGPAGKAYNEERIRKSEEQCERERMERLARLQPRCPNCQSFDVSRITLIGRGLSVAVLGLASDKIGKTFKCNRCGYTW